MIWNITINSCLLQSRSTNPTLTTNQIEASRLKIAIIKQKWPTISSTKNYQNTNNPKHINNWQNALCRFNVNTFKIGWRRHLNRCWAPISKVMKLKLKTIHRVWRFTQSIIKQLFLIIGVSCNSHWIPHFNEQCLNIHTCIYSMIFFTQIILAYPSRTDSGSRILTLNKPLCTKTTNITS